MSLMKNYHDRVQRLLPGGVHYNFRTPWKESPPHFINAQGSYLWDMDGKEYIDLCGRFGSCILGHGNQEYGESLKQTIDRVLSVKHTNMDAECLELVNKFIPSAEMIRFGLSGTEIIQVALRLARAYTKKNKFIRFTGHYHGNADNIMGGKTSNKDVDPIPHEYLDDLKGTSGRANNILEQQSFLLPWNDIVAVTELLEKYSSDIAAIITEPVCVNGGTIMPKPGYLAELRQLCDKYGVMLIFDEVITGVRMGLGGAQSLYGIIPDLSILGKAVAGGGLPVSLLVGKKSIMSLIDNKTVVHAGTFNGYSLGISAVKVTLEILSRCNGSEYEKMNDNTVKVHNIFMQKASKYELPMVIQGPLACASYHCTDKNLSSVQDYKYSLIMNDIILNSCLEECGVIVSLFSRIYPNIALSNSVISDLDGRIDSAICLAAAKIHECMGI